MKKGLIILIAVLVIAGIVVMSTFGSYNSLVAMDEEVNNQWANVESKLQLRFDLIPNLVETVKGAMAHEQEVFTAIADARARLAGAGSTDEKVQASNELEGALSRLLVVVENYPELKSNQNVTALMDTLAGTENRISVERDRYNGVVSKYNSAIRSFPKNIMAGMFGFETRPYFEASPGADVAPKVNFD
ncbi:MULTISPECIES: LemA family protein [Sedimentibacter]|uniref:LemA family protein n=1 Tax=Sedimentibacter hydroxybenzoicus DSM 7310 TaxID=1123245 RepID=A0A974GY03_SEDHY|nr:MULTISPECIES: LemA family protein [Sedimentibacter]NYB76088.1 LemA family protein [Sedimentibacter hydroxybenzoicus DSM 7310]